MTNLRLGEGVSGKADGRGAGHPAGDYLEAEFRHDELADALARTTGIRDLIVAPIIGDDGPLGAIEVFRREPHAFDDARRGGPRRPRRPGRHRHHQRPAHRRSWSARRRRSPDAPRPSARCATSPPRIAALHDPDEVLERVVEEAKRLLGTDGAHLTRMADDGHLPRPGRRRRRRATTRPRHWLLAMRFPLGGGINGLAAEHRRARSGPSTTSADPRIPHEPDDDDVAERLGLRGMAAAPLRAPGRRGHRHARRSRPRAAQLRGRGARPAPGPRRPGRHRAHQLERCSTRLTESEERYPVPRPERAGLVWSIGPDGRLTFLSDAVERLTGRRAESCIGQHFGALVHESSREVAEIDWASGLADREPGAARPAQPARHRDGEPVPAEFIATARLDDAGSFVGANGSVRDMRERDRLETRAASESEERYPTARPDDARRHLSVRRRGPVHVRGRGRRGALRLDPGRGRRQDLRATSTAEASLPRPSRTSSASASEHDVVRRYPLHAQPPRRRRPGRVIVGLGLRGRPVRRRPGHRPRHQRAGAARARAARVARSATASSSRTRRTSSSPPTPDGTVHVRVGGDRVDDSDCDARASSIGSTSRAIVRTTRWPDRRRSLGAARRATRRPSRSAELVLTGTGRPADPGRGQRDRRSSDADGEFAGDPRRGPRHRRARAPRARAARVGGALPVPRRVLPGRRLGHRRRRAASRSSAMRPRRCSGMPADELIGQPVLRRSSRPTLRSRGEVRFKWLEPASDVGPPSRLPFRHADGHDVLGRDQRHRHGRRRRGSSGSTARPATSASATGSSASCAARPASSRPARSAPTWPASSTTRSPRRSSR